MVPIVSVINICISRLCARTPPFWNHEPVSGFLLFWPRAHRFFPIVLMITTVNSRVYTLIPRPRPVSVRISFQSKPECRKKKKKTPLGPNRIRRVEGKQRERETETNTKNKTEINSRADEN